MNRQRLLAIVLLIVVLALFGWLLLLREADTPTYETSEPATPGSATSQFQTSMGTDMGRKAAQPLERSRATASKSSFEKAVDEFVQKAIADPTYEWKQPINFYGRVVGDNEQPIEGAAIHFSWTDLSADGTSEVDVKSNADGRFSLHDRTGKRLSVNVGKEGYYSRKGEVLRSFEYADPSSGLFTPDSNNPVIYHLRKQGETEPLVVMRGNMNVPGVGRKFSLPTNGVPVGIDLFRGRNVQAGGQVEVQCGIFNESGRFNEPYDWQYKINVPGGGITPATNEFNFEAPVEGYQRDMAVEVRADLGRAWANKTEGNFFLRLADGKYALMRFTIYAGRNPFCLIESFVNPSGSRNLELDPDKIIIAQ